MTGSDAVFISDLHLSPYQPEITRRFESFIAWACQNAKAVYILGDFFHVWSGDDLMDPWSECIAKILASLAEHQATLYWLPGNRDFLVGQHFLRQAKAQLLADGALIQLNNRKVMLTHGDQYCTADKSHQWLRIFTRNAIFIHIFQWLPKAIRNRLVSRVRNYSASHKPRPQEIFLIDNNAVKADIMTHKADILIHGHIHKVQQVDYDILGRHATRYVLSDWDDMPSILCYDKTKGFSFNLLGDLLCQ